MTGQLLTLGVEEEFLLLDPGSGENKPAVAPLVAALDDEMRERNRPEFRPSMLEMVTPVCTELPELRRFLLAARRAAATAATKVDAALVAVAATPIAERERVATDDPRFKAIVRHYGPIATDPSVCGCHVHVGVPDRDTAIEVGNRLREWLPVVQALAANSPFAGGADTGHASWRSMQLERWPSLGPAPWFDTAADYDRTVAAMIAAGAMRDETMIFWYARPSRTYPTVEVRVADVCLTVDDTVLVAGLIRALVATALDDLAAGTAAAEVPDQLLRAAHWNAAQQGLSGTLLDPRSGRARPAWELVEELAARVRPALQRSGDLSLVDGGLARLRREGTGADRQRRAFARTGDLRSVLTHLAEQTVLG